MILILPNQLFPIEHYLNQDSVVYFCYFAPVMGFRREYVPFSAAKSAMMQREIDKYIDKYRAKIAGIIPLESSLNVRNDSVKVFNPEDKLTLMMLRYVFPNLEVLDSPAFLIHEVADIKQGLKEFHKQWVDKLRRRIKPQKIEASPPNMLWFLLEMGVILPDDVLLIDPHLVIKREYYRQIYRRLPVNGINLSRRDFWKFPPNLTALPPIDEIINLVEKKPMKLDDDRIVGIFLNFCTITQIYPPSVVCYLVSNIPWYSHYYAAVQVYEYSYAITKIVAFRPFFTTSTYLMKNYPGVCSGNWEEIWNSLYYNFIYENRDSIAGFVMKNWKRKSKDEKNWHLILANEFYSAIYSQDG